MVVQVGSASCASVVVASSSEILLNLMEAPIQAIAPMNMTSVVYPMNFLETVLKTVECLSILLRMKELVNAALEVLVMARFAAKNMVEADEYLSSYPEIITHLFIKTPDFRFATHFDTPLSQGSNLSNEALLKDEMDRSCDQCKACTNELLVQGPVQEPDGLLGGGTSEWIVSAARGKGEVNSNHAKTDEAFVAGKKDKPQQDDDDDEDDDVDDEGESGDEENDDGDEGEEEDVNEEEEDDDEEEEEEEEEDDEDDEEVAPLSAHVNKAVQNVEADDDSDEGEDEEEGVEDEDDFEEDGEDDDVEEDEEDEDDDGDEDVQPPKKKNKSS